MKISTLHLYHTACGCYLFLLTIPSSRCADTKCHSHDCLILVELARPTIHATPPMCRLQGSDLPDQRGRPPVMPLTNPRSEKGNIRGKWSHTQCQLTSGLRLLASTSHCLFGGESFAIRVYWSPSVLCLSGTGIVTRRQCKKSRFCVYLRLWSELEAALPANSSVREGRELVVLVDRGY